MTDQPSALARLGFTFPVGTIYTISEDGKQLSISFITVGFNSDIWTGFHTLGENKERHRIDQLDIVSDRIYDNVIENVITIIFK